MDKLIRVIYTPQAYLRMRGLVRSSHLEIAWYGLAERTEDGNFRIFDAIPFKQTVTGSRVETDDKDQCEFFEKLDDDKRKYMRYLGHSHVAMPVTASPTDLQNQQDIVAKFKSGFYIFQIWNSNNEINTTIYDLDNQTIYERQDIVLTVEDSDYGTVYNFINEAKKMAKKGKN